MEVHPLMSDESSHGYGYCWYRQKKEEKYDKDRKKHNQIDREMEIGTNIESNIEKEINGEMRERIIASESLRDTAATRYTDKETVRNTN
jgi:hypothetical protein